MPILTPYPLLHQHNQADMRTSELAKRSLTTRHLLQIHIQERVLLVQIRLLLLVLQQGLRQSRLVGREDMTP